MRALCVSALLLAVPVAGTAQTPAPAAQQPVAVVGENDIALLKARLTAVERQLERDYQAYVFRRSVSFDTRESRANDIVASQVAAGLRKGTHLVKRPNDGRQAALLKERDAVLVLLAVAGQPVK